MVYGRDHNGDRGKVNGLKKTKLPCSLRSRVMAGDDVPVRACSLRSGKLLARKVVGETAHSPVQFDSPVFILM